MSKEPQRLPPSDKPHSITSGPRRSVSPPPPKKRYEAIAANQQIVALVEAHAKRVAELQHQITEREGIIQSMAMRTEQLLEAEKDNARLRELLRECLSRFDHYYQADIVDRIKAAIE